VAAVSADRFFARRLAFEALALRRLRVVHCLRHGPMTIRLAFGAALVEPQEIGNLTDPIVTVGHDCLQS